jgi:hypothetical protein
LRRWSDPLALSGLRPEKRLFDKTWKLGDIEEVK